MTDSSDMTLSEQPIVEASRRPFEEPKLAFIEPELKNLGDVRDVTATFVASFTP